MPSIHDFLPRRSGFHFVNSWPRASLLDPIDLGFVKIPIGDASNGLCGGMTFAARDYFEAHMYPPSDTVHPDVPGSRLYNYLVHRLFDSFNLPSGPTKYRYLMDPTLPDHDTDIGPHGRAWIMIKEECPKIQSDINSGIPSPLGLITTKSLNPLDMGQNHQVLAYRYDIHGDQIDIYVYDPNHPNTDDVIISLNTSNPKHTTEVLYSYPFSPPLKINCFFRIDYQFKYPEVTTVPPGPKVPEACKPIEAEVKSLQSQIKSLQDELQGAPTSEKGRINAEIKELNKMKSRKEQELRQCIEAH